ncbi:MAG: hypothetical protein Roseis2KO_33890 [Roseivirga sp.]
MQNKTVPSTSNSFISLKKINKNAALIIAEFIDDLSPSFHTLLNAPIGYLSGNTN